MSDNDEPLIKLTSKVSDCCTVQLAKGEANKLEPSSNGSGIIDHIKVNLSNTQKDDETKTSHEGQLMMINFFSMLIIPRICFV